ncbi:hypothetical protein RHGRI_005863 [Rhododendron griersonianum]|uniref:BHLH domain-containing protein n=1 Tax=Rhododendron griersonianum TaxID=479676 RepID=A0AAV6LEV5_9ERIC|nr:hypothetical protein RHGRI_005863 [Rhododendron griersonianum]
MASVPENLTKQLAVAVRSIQWSYAIFWSISSRHPGALEWGDGYYNGDIKTRKTIQAVEFNADQLGLLQRSEQLRELYESLAAGESSPQARRPSAALSPEDLTDTEWYYLVCMSFVFNIGQGLPGRTLSKGQPIWVCNAHYADSKVFSRSLLAKSASIQLKIEKGRTYIFHVTFTKARKILVYLDKVCSHQIACFQLQTVVCFPFLGGVVELGVTDLVLEDPSLVQHIKTSFLETPYPKVSKISNSFTGNANQGLIVHAKLDHEILDTNLNPVFQCEDFEVCSPNNSTNGLGINPQPEESFLVEGLYEANSQVQSWQLMDDEVCNGVHNSFSSSDCISQTLVNPEKASPLPDEMTKIGLQANDIHYQSVISTLLKSSQHLILGPNFRNSNQESSFVRWKKGGLSSIQTPKSRTPQFLLKKVLLEVARMHGDHMSECSREDSGRKDAIWRPQVDDIDSNHVLAERRRREKLNKRFSVLGSLVPSDPSTSKVDKVSILDHTIEYLRELERRVEELDSGREVSEPEVRTRKTPKDSAERTSESHGHNKKPSINKRKVRDIDEIKDPYNTTWLRDPLNKSVESGHRKGRKNIKVVTEKIHPEKPFELSFWVVAGSTTGCFLFGPNGNDNGSPGLSISSFRRLG